MVTDHHALSAVFYRQSNKIGTQYNFGQTILQITHTLFDLINSKESFVSIFSQKLNIDDLLSLFVKLVVAELREYNKYMRQNKSKQDVDNENLNEEYQFDEYFEEKLDDIGQEKWEKTVLRGMKMLDTLDFDE